jgi:KDO2-lipid IV(A) lauroyltransferase
MRRVFQKNISVITGHKPEDPMVKRLARDTWRNYGYYMMDYVQLNRIGKPNNKYLIPEQRGTRHIVQALENGKGGILITPHLGNWELGGVTFAMRGCPVYALTLKDSVEKAQDFRDEMRSTLGIRSIHIDPTRYDTILRLARLLRENNFLAMLGDRYEGGKKAVVNFFGRRVIFPAGASALALSTGAPIIPVFTVVKPNGTYLAWAEPPIVVSRKSGRATTQIIEEKTQEIAHVFEKAIALYPDQWFHFFDYWSRYGC